MYLYETISGPVIQYCTGGGSFLYRRQLEFDSENHLHWSFWECLENAPILKKWPSKLKINGRKVELIDKSFPNPAADERTGLHKIMKMVRTRPIIELHAQESLTSSL